MVLTLRSKPFLSTPKQPQGLSATPHCTRWGLSLLLFLIMGMSPMAVQATTCANAIVINPASLPITDQALVCGAANDLNTTNVPGTICGSNSSEYYKGGTEALYSFTPTTTASYQLSYTGQTWSAAMVYIGCPTLNNCLYGSGQTGSSVSFTVTLNAGITYFIWFDTWPSPASPCPGTFSLTPPPPPITNDNPCQAVALTVNANLLCGTQTPGSLVGATATAGITLAPCGGTPNDDVWFSFVATGPTHHINLNNVSGSPTDLYHAVYSGTCGSLVNVSCSDPDASVVSGLIAGTTYWLRVYSWSSSSGATSTFNVCIGSPPPPPACGQMFYDPGGPSGAYSNNTNSTVTICPTIAGQVVSLVFSQFDLENNWDYLRIYNGTSAAAPLLGTLTGTSLPPTITANNASGCLTAVFTSDVSGVGSGWAAQVNCGPPPPSPTNDNPCGAISLTVNPNQLCGIQTPGTLVLATATSTVPTAPCGGTPNDDVWFSFVATGPTHMISLNNIAGNTNDLYHAVYSGNCNSLTNIACSDPESSVVNGLIPGNTYWLRVYSWANNAGATSTFNVCIGSPPPPPGCGEIFYDSGGPTGTYLPYSNQTTTICPSTAGDMVSLVFTQFALETNWDYLYVYNGNSTSSPLIGTFTGSTLPPTLTASNPSGCLTVVFTSDGSGQYEGWAAQIICGPMPSGDCVYALHLHDSAGNGWGTSAVGVSINGGPYVYHTVTAANNIIFIGLNIGDVIVLNYIATGPDQGQNSYSIGKIGFNPYFTSTSPPVAGNTFMHTVDCGAPPAPPQDCIGGITICSSQAITNNSGNIGEVMDLNSTNQGCLSSGERQGTWYYFSPQTGGTIAFSIAPSNGTDDYDFALWGPFANAQCPSGPPLRCSYDAPGPYTTGLNATATQTTEGASGTGWVRDIDVVAGQVYVLYIDNFSTTGQAFTLNWTLTNGATLDCTTLAVELISLEAKARKPVIDVTWATTTEKYSSHFVVERSADNETFTPIGSVDAAGHSLFRSDYAFVDEAPSNGVNYYRLQQMDQDGNAVQTHSVVATLFADDGKPTIFPNPAQDVLNVVFNSAQEGQAVLLLEDALGRTIARSTVEVLRTENRSEVPLTDVAKGWYNLRIALPDGSLMQGGAFLKQ